MTKETILCIPALFLADHEDEELVEEKKKGDPLYVPDRVSHKIYILRDQVSEYYSLTDGVEHTLVRMKSGYSYRVDMSVDAFHRLYTIESGVDVNVVHAHIPTESSLL